MTLPVSPSASSSPIPPARATRRVWVSLLVAFIAEALILLAGAVWMISHGLAPPRPALGSIRLDLTKLPTPAPAPAAPPASPEPAAEIAAKPAPEAPTAPDAPPVPTAPDRPPPEVLDRPVARRQAALESPPMPLPDLSLLPRDDAPAGRRQPAPPQANGQMILLSEFNRQLNEALRAAARDLKSSRGIKTTGQVEITLHYRDGKAWGLQILRSSGSSAIDQAMLHALAQATWPPPPRGLEGHEIILPITGSIW
jgi:outer membrane biosynthesis protein TonB